MDKSVLRERLKFILNVQTDDELKRALKELQDLIDITAEWSDIKRTQEKYTKVATILYWLRQEV